MKNFTYEMTLEAETEKEAEEKMKHLTTLARKLNSKETGKLAEVVSNPVKLAIAKQKLGV